VIAISICDEVGITQKSVFEKIAFSALAHDLGLSLIPKDLTPDEAIEYMELLIGQPFNKEVFRALKNIVIKASVLKSA
jgi:HD-GYP domain-containing protein (c-di-GMP phosphodiesterase class II)